MKRHLYTILTILLAVGLLFVSCSPENSIGANLVQKGPHIVIKAVSSSKGLDKPLVEYIYQVPNGVVTKDTVEKIQKKLGIHPLDIRELTFVETQSIEAAGEGSSVFGALSNLKTVVADEKLESIGSGAFSGCSGIESVILNGAKEIGASAFEDCTSLTAVTLKAIEKICENAFAGVEDLKEITFPSTIKDIQKGAFKDANFDKVKFEGKAAPKVYITAFDNTENKDTALDFPGKDGEGNVEYYKSLTYNFYSMASAQPSSQTVSYNLLKGESAMDEQEKAVLEGPYGEYSFKGWSDKNDSVSLSGLVSMVDGTNYYAVYEKKVKVTFDKNSAVATGTENPVESTDGLMLIALGDNKTKTAVDKVSVTLPLTTSFTRTGYTFDGWKDASENSYSAGSSVELSADTELKTQWKANPYAVSFAYKDFGGNEQAITAAQNSVNYDAYVSFPTAPTREGWTFVGWSKDNKSSNTVSTYKCDFTAAQKFYAVYKKAVNLNLYFVDAAYKNLPATLYNCNETASVNASSYASYTWSTSNTAYVPFTGTLSSTTAIKEDTKLYQYKADLSVAVKYYTAAKVLKKTDTKTVKAVAKENISGGFNILSGETIALLDLKSSLVTASDYNKVKGWKIGETSYAFGANYAPASKTVDVYAEEEAKEYTITFYAYDKTTSFGNAKVKYTDDKDKTINSFSSKTTVSTWINSDACSAYVFTGWKKEATGFPSKTARDYADTDTIGTVLAANKTADTIELYATLATPVVNFLGTGGWISKTIDKTKIKSIEFKDVKMPAGTTQTFYLDDANKAVPAVFNSSTGALTVYLGKAKIAPKDGFMKGTFQDMSNLESVKGLKYFDLSEVTTIENIFFSCQKLTSIEKFALKGGKLVSTRAAFSNDYALTFGPDFFSDWNTSAVTDMINMFNFCRSATSIPVKDLDTSSCTNFGNMFYGCSALTSIDLSSFNTAKVTNLNKMFGDCAKLTTINVTNWDTSKVTDMTYMFEGCSSLISLDLTSWSTASMVVNSNTGASKTGSMFYNCKALTAVYVSSKWTLKPMAGNTFQGCNISDYTKR
ncbi:MAG: leucine-rich repeat protein [Spirochaetales bacterium]|nr:leucine-rich repeat protein [Candidatus Physcosoma equi]